MVCKPHDFLVFGIDDCHVFQFDDFFFCCSVPSACEVAWRALILVYDFRAVAHTHILYTHDFCLYIYIYICIWVLYNASWLCCCHRHVSWATYFRARVLFRFVFLALMWFNLWCVLACTVVFLNNQICSSDNAIPSCLSVLSVFGPCCQCFV